LACVRDKQKNLHEELLPGDGLNESPFIYYCQRKYIIQEGIKPRKEWNGMEQNGIRSNLTLTIHVIKMLLRERKAML